MNIDEIKDRLSKVKPRLSNLLEKYPVVFVSLALAGAVLGFVVGYVVAA